MLEHILVVPTVDCLDKHSVVKSAGLSVAVRDKNWAESSASTKVGLSGES